MYRGVKCFINKKKKNCARTNLLTIIIFFLLILFIFFLILFTFLILLLFLLFLAFFGLDNSLFCCIRLLFSSVCSNILFMLFLQLSSLLLIRLLVSSAAVLFHISPSFFATSPMDRPGCSPLTFGRYSEQNKKKAEGGL